jgi:GT2 family glycosyltransferase
VVDEKRDMDISVVITSWNTKSLLLECVESILSETQVPSIEVIVVDNASTDGSPEAVEEKFSNVKVVRNERNLGFAKANNIGIKLSVGRYISLVNSDVRVLKGCFDRLYQYMEEYPAVGIAGPKMLNSDMTVQRTCRRFPTLWSTFCCAVGLDKVFPKSYTFGGEARFFYPDDEIGAVDVLTGCFWILRREAVKQVGLLNEAFFFYGEDLDWCKRFWSAGWKIVFFPNAQAIHYGGTSSSQAPTIFAIEKEKATLQYWKEHFSRFSKSILLCIMWLHHIIRIINGCFLYFLNRRKRPRVVQEMGKHISCIRWLLTSELGKK